MAEPVDFYEVLQLSPNAEDEVIQAAFKRLALKWHPDRRPGDPLAAEQMKLLNAAYEVLSDPQKRKKYDARRKRSALRQAAEASTPPATTPPAVVEESPGVPERRKRPQTAAVREREKFTFTWLVEASHVQPLALCLVGLGLADLLMTYFLLRISPHFYEWNPVAQWFFQRWNILGMTLYKFALVGTVIALSEVIERGRPGWGRLVLLGGCGATTFVIARGLRLYLDMGG